MRNVKVPNLHQQHNTYFFRRVLPPDVRPFFGGKVEYKVSLRTSDLRIAKTRIGAYREVIDAQIALHRGQPGRLMDLAKAYRQRGEAIGEEHPDPEDLRRLEDADSLVEEVIDTFVETQIVGGWKTVMEHDGVNPDKIDAISNTPGGSGIRRFLGDTFGKDLPTDALIEEWLSTYDVADKTRRMAESEVRIFARAFPRLSMITKGAVAKWLQRRQQRDGLAVATIRRNLSHIRGYALYLEDRELLEHTESIFKYRTTGKQTRREKDKRAWVAWSPEEAVTLWKAADQADDIPLRDAIWLGMWTGARLDEICSWTGVDILEGHFIDNKDGKTKAAVRQIPIHPKLRDRVSELVAAAGAKPLIPCRAKNRTQAISKRFARLADTAGLHDERKVFHSLRKTVTTQLQNARVPADMIQYIIAHKQQFTFDVYSAGLENREAMHEAIAILTYPID
jgi:integrase